MPPPPPPEEELDDASERSCEFCDVSTQQALASRLLHTLAIRSTKKKQTVDEAESNLREKLLPPPTSGKGQAQSLAVLDAALDAAENITTLGTFFSSKEEVQKRVAACEQELELSFRPTRRDRLAAELIRAYDVERRFHCGHALLGGGGGGCSPASTAASERHQLTCIFRPLACQNEGCFAVFSARSEAQHDDTCGFKRLQCKRGCGQNVERQKMADHTDGECANKPVECPFVHLGCKQPCTQGTLNEHLQTATAAHLTLSLRVIPMQQHAINSLEAKCAAAMVAATELAVVSARVGALEAGLDDMKKSTKQAVTELKAAMVKDIDALSKQHGKDHKKLDEGLAKVTKAHAALDKENRGEVEKLRKTVGEVFARMHGGAAPPAK